VAASGSSNQQRRVAMIPSDAMARETTERRKINVCHIFDYVASIFVYLGS
jgi:hypothetical protein